MSADQASRPCKLCGRPLVFARDTEGRVVALDATAPVWVLRRDSDGEPVAVRSLNGAVTHHATCTSEEAVAKRRAGEW